MAATIIDPNKPLAAPVAAAPVASPGGASVIDPSNPAPAPAPGVTSSQPGGATAIDPNKGSVAGTGTWGDFATVAGNESMMNSLPALRAQVEAARQRLGPNWAAGADASGSIASPTSLLNLVPYVGPELAGGAHEGISSYNRQPNWWPDAAARTQIAKDTAFGVATGGLGHVGAAYAPKVLPFITEEGLRGGPRNLAAAHYIDQSFGSIGADLVGFTGLYKALNKPGEWLGSQAEKIADQPATQNAIKLATQGAGAALRASSPSSQWDQWVPWQ